MSTLAFTVPGKPVSWERLRTSGKRRFESKKVTAQKKAIRLCANIDMSLRHITKPLHWPIALHVVAVFGRPKGKPDGYPEELWERHGEIPSRSANDCDNILKLVADALQGVVYENDREIVEMRCHKVYGTSNRTEIVVEEIDTTEA